MRAKWIWADVVDETLEPYGPLVPLPEPVGAQRAILELERDACKWPIGDPVDVDFRFCGARQRDGASYCEAHCRDAYQPRGVRREAAKVRRVSGAFGVMKVVSARKMEVAE
jgi:GcrA cell cycle regulator